MAVGWEEKYHWDKNASTRLIKRDRELTQNCQKLLLCYSGTANLHVINEKQQKQKTMKINQRFANWDIWLEFSLEILKCDNMLWDATKCCNLLSVHSISVCTNASLCSRTCDATTILLPWWMSLRFLCTMKTYINPSCFLCAVLYMIF